MTISKHVLIRATDPATTATASWADTALDGTTILYITGDIELLNFDTAINIEFRFEAGEAIEVPSHTSGFAQRVITLNDQVYVVNPVTKIEVKADSGTPAYQIVYRLDTRYH